MTQSFINTALIPLVKDKKDDITAGDNYRPIAKLMELIILDMFLHKTGNQFGLSILNILNIIDCYLVLFICVISKAFHRINHWTRYI